MTPEISQDLIDGALDLAAQWQRRAQRLISSEEKTRQEKMQRLLRNPQDKVTLVKLFDQSFRSSDPARVADQIQYLFRTWGVPDFFSTSEKGLLSLFRGFGSLVPSLTIPQFIARMRASARAWIIDGEPEALRAYLEARRSEGVQVNLNRLGEEVLGEHEASRRLQAYVEDLKNPLIEDISVKISTLYSQIQSLSFEDGVERISERLALLYRAALQHPRRSDHRPGPATVHLDMEAYQDLALTVAAFQRTLDQEEFSACPAGIALQAYVPDSFACQRSLTRWSLQRVARGGSPIHIRIVKGANLEMEQVEAALGDWPPAPYDNKTDVDANYKRMLLYGLVPGHMAAARLGVASHNLFELAFAWQAACANGVEKHMRVEMLEGMAGHVRRALVQQAVPVMLYTPVATEKEFLNAIAYLIRRMDENTGPENFLRYAPAVTPGSATWRRLAQQFADSCKRMRRLNADTHRIQNRLTESWPAPNDQAPPVAFQNEPNTDWALSPNREWAERIRERWRKGPHDEAVAIPLVAAGRIVADERPQREIVDPSRLPEKVVPARCAQATAQDIERAVAAGRADPDGWRSLVPEQRRAVLDRVAQGLRAARADLIGAAAAETGKLFSEADIEVSEAVDFAVYYPLAAAAFEQRRHLQVRGKGLGVVVSPWNFPIAIPAGGLLAALAAGNTVIFKPSSEALLTAWRLCNVFWDAGVSRSTLQFLPCSGSAEGPQLTGHAQVDFVILTGGTSTALQILSARPDLFMAAETGGKNSTIVTAVADREQAVRNIMQSAFSHSGQKCSATSLLILEKEVYNDRHFKQMLVDAAASLPVGSAWDFSNRMGPLIHPPRGALLRGLTRLEHGETWALAPGQAGDNPNLWTPGIKWGVQPGSFTHMTELFGPVLGVMRADDLEEAVALANQTGYGLTAGIESLDPRETDRWKASIRAGNLYINRSTTGAVTLRQPFGGIGKSAVGPAIKAGGPDYVTQFMTFSEIAEPPIKMIREAHPLLALAQRWQRQCRWGQMQELSGEVQKIVVAIQSCLHHAQNDFFPPRDHFHLRGQDNLLRHIPVGRLAVCLHPDDTLFETAVRLAAGRISGCRVTLIRPPGLSNAVTEFLDGEEGRLLLQQVQVRHQNDAQTARQVTELDRLRYTAAGRVPREVYTAAAEAGIYIARDPVLMDGRVELLHYLSGQSICDNYHRHGNLGERGLTALDEPL